jgi:Fe-S cluster assembly protein SufD|tara:strand:+ start:1469 stop:2599 length:1131 start_codon:yes stop_codon:yes gene_type:complete
MSCVATSSVPRVAPRAANARRARADRVARRTSSCGLGRPAATTAEASVVDVASIEDAWIAGSLERCAVGEGVVKGLREGALARLATARMPNQRIEEYRFTDLAPLVTQKPSKADPALAAGVDASAWTLAEADKSRVVLIDGVFSEALSNLSGVGSAITVGAVSVGAATSDALGAVSGTHGGIFVDLNAACASDVIVVTIPTNTHMTTPLHVLQLSTASGEGCSASAPRLVVDVGQGASLDLVEEFACVTGTGKQSAYWLNGVCDLTVGANASVKHSMVQNQTRAAVHTRATYVTQGEESEYSLAEISVGGRIGRHNLHIKQLGPRTVTSLACFNLSGAGQCLDLHSSVVLDFEEGKTDQVRIGAFPNPGTLFQAPL